LAFAALFIWMSAGATQILHLGQTGNTTQGTVLDRDAWTRVNGGRRVEVTVTYQVGEQVFVEQLSLPENIERLRRGDYVTLFYDPENPGRVSTGELDLWSTIFYPGVLVVCTVMVIYVSRRDSKKRKTAAKR